MLIVWRNVKGHLKPSCFRSLSLSRLLLYDPGRRGHSFCLSSQGFCPYVWRASCQGGFAISSAYKLFDTVTVIKGYTNTDLIIIHNQSLRTNSWEPILKNQFFRTNPWERIFENESLRTNLWERIFENQSWVPVLAHTPPLTQFMTVQWAAKPNESSGEWVGEPRECVKHYSLPVHSKVIQFFLMGVNTATTKTFLSTWQMENHWLIIELIKPICNPKLFRTGSNEL